MCHMGKWNIFNRDPSFYQNLFIEADKKLSYVPVLSILTTSVNLCLISRLKDQMKTLSGRDRVNNNAYYVYLNSKKINRTLLLFIPILGNITVALMDFYRYKQIQKEKKSPLPNLQLRLAKRYIIGDGVKKDLKKSQNIFNQCLKDINNYKVRSLYALQFLDGLDFESCDLPYERVKNLIKGIKDDKELSKLNKICTLRAKLWEDRTNKFKSKSGYDIEEYKKMNKFKQGYVNAATLCEKQKEALANQK